jgi:hypothetical protein
MPTQAPASIPGGGWRLAHRLGDPPATRWRRRCCATIIGRPVNAHARLALDSQWSGNSCLAHPARHIRLVRLKGRSMTRWWSRDAGADDAAGGRPVARRVAFYADGGGYHLVVRR